MSEAERVQIIAAALADEIERQSRGGRLPRQLDVGALAGAVEAALNPAEHVFDEGTPPQDLNATNDG